MNVVSFGRCENLFCSTASFQNHCHWTYVYWYKEKYHYTLKQMFDPCDKDREGALGYRTRGMRKDTDEMIRKVRTAECVGLLIKE